MIPVEVNVTEGNFFSEDEGSGSGLGELVMYNPATSMPTSGADITDFSNLISDSVGQLYAYYYSNTSVVLATRSAINTSRGVQIAIGVAADTDDVYVCEAENFPERNSNSGISIINVTVKAISRKLAWVCVKPLKHCLLCNKLTINGVCLSSSTQCSGCMVNGLGAMAAV